MVTIAINNQYLSYVRCIALARLLTYDNCKLRSARFRIQNMFCIRRRRIVTIFDAGRLIDGGVHQLVIVERKVRQDQGRARVFPHPAAADAGVSTAGKNGRVGIGESGPEIDFVACSSCLPNTITLLFMYR